MIQTETSKAKIIFVEVPNEIVAYSLRHHMDGTLRSLRVSSKDDSYEICVVPEGNWTILNTLDDVTEDEAKMVLHEYTFGLYANYFSKKRIRFSSAIKSIHSLATSLGVEGKTIILYQLK